MSLKLVVGIFVVLCAAAVAFAAPPGKQEFVDNKEETIAQVCDDPCVLCELLKDREAQIKGASSDAKQQQLPLQQSRPKDFLSMARIAAPPGERKAAAEGACIDVCAQCSVVRERKAEEQAMINAIVKMLLSQ